MQKSKNIIQNYPQDQIHMAKNIVIQIQHLKHHIYKPQNHPLSLLYRNFRSLAITNPPNFKPNTKQSPIKHIVTQQPQNDHTYKQIIEQPHTTTFQSQNNHFFSPR